MLNNGEAIVDAKVPDDVGAFKNWLRQINQHVAEASRRADFSGLAACR